MSSYEYESLPPPNETLALEQNILALGIEPSRLAELSIDEARFVLLGMSKMLSRLTHPDYVCEGTTVFGLDIRDVNVANDSIEKTDHDTLAIALANLSKESVVGAERKLREEADAARQRIHERNIELGELLLGKESLGEPYTGRLFIQLFPDNPGSDNESPYDQNAMEITLLDGVVTAQHQLFGEGKLVTKLPKAAQAFAQRLRPDLKSPVQLIFISEELAKETKLPVNSWCKLLTAKHRDDPAKNAAAIKIYDPNHSDSYDEDELVGTRLFGKFTPESLTKKTRPKRNTPQEWPPRELAVQVTFGTGDKDILRTSLQEAAQLVAQGQLEPSHTPMEESDKGYSLVFVRTKPSSGRPAVAYFIASPIQATPSTNDSKE